MSDEEQPATGESRLRSITFKLSPADIERLRRITRRRYPEDRNMMAQTLREIIREEDEREKTQRDQR